MSLNRIAWCALAALGPMLAFVPGQISGEGQISKSILPSRINPKASLDAGTATGASSLASCANGVCYHGGPVMLGTPTVYYIWYGNWAADPTAVSILSHFAQFDGGSPYYAINTTYYDSSNTHISNSVNFGPSYTDNYSLGKVLDDAGVEAIVANAISGGHLPSDKNGVYFVLTWQDVQETTGFITSYCGWHANATINGVDIKFAFVGNANTQGLAACAVQTGNSPNGDPAADAMASIIAHELEESVTDPDGTAWYDNAGNEVADKCAWTFGTSYLASNGSVANMRLGGLDYLIQQNWVNGLGGYCALQWPATPILSTISPASGAAGASPTVTLTGTTLNGATLHFSGSGITAAIASASATQITATFNIAPGAAAGTQAVTATNSAGASNSLTFTVTTPPPALSSISPSSGAPGTAVNVTLNGSNLAGASLSAMAGIAISGLSSTASQVRATFTIASTAAPGSRNVTVTTAAGTSNVLSFTVNAPAGGFTPIRINAGGGAYTDSHGNLWSADSNYNNGSLHSTTNAISGTSDPALFQTFHQSPEVNPTVYTFNGIPNGSYTVTLGFAESQYFSVGARTFNVAINGAAVLTNFDIFATVGGNAALSESFPISVTGGQIAIQFSAVRQNPIVNAIAIVSNGPPPTLNSITPASGVAGTSVPVTLSGANLSGASLNFSGSGISATGVTSTATQVTATFVISAGAAPGPQNVTVTTPGGTSGSVTFTVTAASSPFTPIRINAGGGTYTDTAGNVWSADSHYSNGSLQSTSNPIAGTNDQPLFQTFHQSPEVVPTVYTFNGIPNGTYNVTLGFAEPHYASSGQRLFNVSINGAAVLTNFDIFQAAGAAYTAVTERFPVTVTGGAIVIQFGVIKQNPIVSTILIQ